MAWPALSIMFCQKTKFCTADMQWLLPVPVSQMGKADKIFNNLVRYFSCPRLLS